MLVLLLFLGSCFLLFFCVFFSLHTFEFTKFYLVICILMGNI